MRISGTAAPMDSHPSSYSQRFYKSDELSLADLWAVIYERRYWILGTLVPAVLLGTAWAFATPHSYDYTTTIEIGARLSGENFVPLESPDAVVAKIKESYIPLVLHDFRNSKTATTAGGSIDAAVPKGSAQIVLRSKGGLDEQATYAALHGAVVQHLTAYHNRILGVVRSNLELTLAETLNKLAQLKDEAGTIETQVTRIAEEEALVQKEVKAMAELVTIAGENLDRAIREAKAEAHVMTLLMLTEGVRQSRTRLMDLEQRAKVELPDKKDALRKLLADKHRARSEKEKAVDSIKLQLSNLQETRTVVPTIQSFAPVGTPRKAIVGLSAVLGLIAGLLVAFIGHFHGNFKNTMQRQQQERRGDDVRASPAILRETSISSAR